MRRRRDGRPAGSRAVAPALAALLILSACGTTGDDAGTSPAPGPPPEAAPALQVSVLLEGLDHPWDVVQAPDGTLLVDERAGGLTAVRAGGGVQEVAADFGDLFAAGETGLMGLAIDPDFGSNRRFYTCQGVTDGGADGGPGIEVIAWSMAGDWTSATRTDDPLVGGIPVNERSGRHGGCRLEFGPDGLLYVGTGDNAVGTLPQDLASRGGKVLRVDPATGAAPPDNPFAGSGNGAGDGADEGADDLVWTYGHRNVQGLAARPGTGQVFSVEHGPDRDDEVNLLEAGNNHGWDPVGAGDYDESVPMTDADLPEVSAAVWRSGAPPVAPSGATFVDGAEWGAYDGALLVGTLRGQGVLALRFEPSGRLVEQFRVPELEGTYGRIRAVHQGSDGNLYLTTDNGGGDDVVLRVMPTG